MAAGRDVLEGKDLSSLRAFVSTGEAWHPADEGAGLHRVDDRGGDEPAHLGAARIVEDRQLKLADAFEDPVP